MGRMGHRSTERARARICSGGIAKDGRHLESNLSWLFISRTGREHGLHFFGYTRRSGNHSCLLDFDASGKKSGRTRLKLAGWKPADINADKMSALIWLILTNERPPPVGIDDRRHLAG